MQVSVPTGWLEIGRIVAAQGLKGEVRVYPNSDFSERFTEPGQRWLLCAGETEPRTVELQSGRYVTGKGLYIVLLAGVSDRTQAELLRDCLLLVPESDRPLLREDEYHVADLIGLSVFDQATQILIGVVNDVMAAGNDLLEVKLEHPQKSSTILIPFVKEIVPVVDLLQRRVEITPPPGLLDL
jgi:16S rRNA processing protein RimM